MFSTDATGRLGVYSVGTALVELGWFFREQPISDFGIDAHAEAPDVSHRPSGRLIALQIKAGPYWFREQVPEGFIYRGSLLHLEYWRAHSLPVVIVLCDIGKKTCFWQAVTPGTVEATPKGWKIVVPATQKLEANSLSILQTLAIAPRPEWSQGPTKPSLAKPVGQNSAATELVMFSAAYCRVTLAKVGKKYRPELYVARGADAEIWEYLTDFLSPSAKSLIMRERAGSGKTNLVCNIASRLLEEGYPCVFILGSQPIGNRLELLAEVLRALGFDPGAGERMQLAVARLGEALELAPLKPLSILIDAINEARDVDAMREALSELCAQLKPLRVRILVTCRDIYWNFLNGEWVGITEGNIRSFDLYRYDAATWPVVLRRYFDAYQITGQLVGDAEQACRHPLLLRFFCEAYEGEEVWVVNHIRLRPLFEKYLEKKVERLASARNSLFRAEESVTECLQSFAAEMLDTNDVSVPEQRATALTGDSGRLHSDSLYVRLLDEDIILDEVPDASNKRLMRRVRFVYEAFFEFMLARELARRWEELTKDEIMDRLVALLDPSAGMRNVRGALAFLDDFFESRQLSVWRELADRAPMWQGVILASLREADPYNLPTALREAFPTLLNSVNHETRVAAVQLLGIDDFRSQLDPGNSLLLHHLLHDRRREVRQQALLHVPLIWPSLNAAQQVEACRTLLDPSTPVRSEANKLLERLDEAAREALFSILCESLHAPQGRVRSYAAIALDLKTWPAARGPLLASLEDPYPWVRRAVLIRLTDHPAEADASVIAARLSDPHPAVRRLAAILCESWKFVAFAPFLEHQIPLETNSNVLSRLAEALVSLNATSSPEALRALLTHSSYWVRAHAGGGLYRALGMEAVRYLAEAVAKRPRGRWIRPWPNFDDFGGASGILTLYRKKFKSPHLDSYTAAFLAAVFVRKTVEEKPSLMNWLVKNLRDLAPGLASAYFHGLRAGSGATLFAETPELRKILSYFLKAGPEAVSISIAYILGYRAPSMTKAELKQMLNSKSPAVREALAWGIRNSHVASIGWSFSGSDGIGDFLEKDYAETTVPGWRDFLNRGYTLTGPTGPEEGQNIVSKAEEDIPF
jgi:HEAT repeat protein